MKTVFFDVDKITRDYLEKQQICTGDTVLLPESMERAPNMTLFPAPVSPVITFKPLSKFAISSSIKI